MCNQEWAWIPREGSETTSRDSSKLRVDVLLEALSIQHKCGHTTNTKYVYDMNNVKQCKMREREKVER